MDCAEVARTRPTNEDVWTAGQVPHEVLNAKPENVARESEIVAQAGRAFAITIATNMAGRGTDILLGGNSGFFAKKKIMQQLAPALLDKKTGLPPREALAIKENPACIPLPEIPQPVLDTIAKAAEACKKVRSSSSPLPPAPPPDAPPSISGRLPNHHGARCKGSD